MNLANETLLIIVVGAVASGKTTLSLLLAKALKNCVYLDKDALFPLSKQIFIVGKERVDRHGKFFYRYVRDPEYDAIEKIAVTAMRYNQRVLLNTPYTGEMKQEARGEQNPHLEKLRFLVHAAGGKLLTVFIDTDAETVKRNMTARNVESATAAERDQYLTDLDEFLKTQNLSAPAEGTIRDTDYYFVFDARRPEDSFRALLTLLGAENTGVEYDAKAVKDLI